MCLLVPTLQVSITEQPTPPEPPEIGSKGPQIVQLLRKKAASGNIDAYADLGTLYKNGWAGLPQDHAESAKWYQPAAERGSAVAQLNLGVFYSLGLGVTKNADEAIRFLRLAAQQGDRKHHQLSFFLDLISDPPQAKRVHR